MAPEPNTTVADLVKLATSQNLEIIGLPAGIEAKAAVEKLEEVDRPLFVADWNPSTVYSGWFPKVAIDQDSNQLFTLKYQNPRDPETGLPALEVMEAAHPYLR